MGGEPRPFGRTPPVIWHFAFPNLVPKSLVGFVIKRFGYKIISFPWPQSLTSPSSHLLFNLNFLVLFQVKRILIGHLMWNSKRGELLLLWNDWRQTESTLSYWRTCSFVKFQFIGCLKIASQRNSFCKIVQMTQKSICLVKLQTLVVSCASHSFSFAVSYSIN